MTAHHLQDLADVRELIGELHDQCNCRDVDRGVAIAQPVG